MVLVYRRTIPKRMYNFFTFSMIFHAALFLFLGTLKQSTSNIFISEISYEEETQTQGPEAVKPQPRVGYLIPPSNLEDMMKGTEGPGGSDFGLGGEATSQPVVDISAKIDRSQAEINLDQYDAGDEGALAVVRIAEKGTGGVKSTEEILAEKPISLSKNLPRGTGGTGGGTMRPGSTIGMKAEAPQIKIDKTVPIAKTTSTIGKQVESQVETKLKTEGAGTSISLAGPIAGRAITRKALPQYPAWCQSRGISGSVKIRIWVNPGGSVREGALIEMSSGYPDLDQSVINAVKIWLFEALPANVQQETQWGVITFRFVCG
jgi:TonB family protein